MNGEIELRVDCLMPEKLIQRATDAGVRFDYVKRPDDHSVVVGIQARDERAMSDICERFAIPVDVTARRGRCATERRARSRWTLLAGLAVFVAASWLFLSRVWKIDIEFSGSAVGRGDEAAVRQVLEDMGVRPGIGRDIDTSLLSSELLARMDGVSFAGARVEGVRLRVEAAPEAPPPEVYDIEASRDLYASRGGIVVSVNAEAGEPCVKPGDTVRRGQLLIRGEEKASSEGTRGIAARGEVVVRTWFEGRATGAVTLNGPLKRAGSPFRPGLIRRGSTCRSSRANASRVRRFHARSSPSAGFSCRSASFVKPRGRPGPYARKRTRRCFRTGCPPWRSRTRGRRSRGTGRPRLKSPTAGYAFHRRTRTCSRRAPLWKSP